ncbi:MAG: dipicolinate synthase subunit B [Clostridiales bacterium]|nr:dipicolinate synthase subunit B [Clostridiales bacterium]
MTANRAGFALCGSFCTLRQAVEEMSRLKEDGWDLFPIMSPIAYATDTRFGTAADFRKRIEDICGRPIIHEIREAEPIGPKKLLDILVIAPCTGNTMGKLACGITDTSVTMAAKAHLRNGRPLLIAPATNDALSASAKNIGALLNAKNVYFVPLGQDDALQKPTSMIADFTQIGPAMQAAMEGRQLQPLLLA